MTMTELIKKLGTFPAGSLEAKMLWDEIVNLAWAKKEGK